MTTKTTESRLATDSGIAEDSAIVTDPGIAEEAPTEARCANPRTVRAPTEAHQQRRLEILVTAAEVFYEKGYHAASMQEIADRLGMLKAGLYHYVAAKEDILFELSLSITEGYLTKLQQTEDELRNANAITRLKGFIGCWIAMVNPRNTSFIAVQREFWQLQPERLAIIEALGEQVQILLEGIVTAGIEDGSFDQQLLPSIAVRNILELLRSLYLWYAPSGDYSLGELTDWYNTFILRGLGYTGRS